MPKVETINYLRNIICWKTNESCTPMPCNYNLTYSRSALIRDRQVIRVEDLEQ